jgi:hypothetical protein
MLTQFKLKHGRTICINAGLVRMLLEAGEQNERTTVHFDENHVVTVDAQIQQVAARLDSSLS